MWCNPNIFVGSVPIIYNVWLSFLDTTHSILLSFRAKSDNDLILEWQHVLVKCFLFSRNLIISDHLGSASCFCLSSAGVSVIHLSFESGVVFDKL